MALTLFILAAAAVASPIAASVSTDMNILHTSFGKDPSATHGTHRQNLRRLEKVLESTTEKGANKPQLGSTEEGVEKPQLGPELEVDKPKKVNEDEKQDNLPKPKAADVVVVTDSSVEDSTESDQESGAEVSEVSDLNPVVEETAVEDSTESVQDSVVEEAIDGKSAEIREEVTEENSDGSDADDKSGGSNTGVLAASTSGMTGDTATSGALGSGSVGALLAATALFSLAVLA